MKRCDVLTESWLYDLLEYQKNKEIKNEEIISEIEAAEKHLANLKNKLYARK